MMLSRNGSRIHGTLLRVLALALSLAVLGGLNVSALADTYGTSYSLSVSNYSNVPIQDLYVTIKNPKNASIYFRMRDVTDSSSGPLLYGKDDGSGVSLGSSSTITQRIPADKLKQGKKYNIAIGVKYSSSGVDWTHVTISTVKPPAPDPVYTVVSRDGDGVNVRASHSTSGAKNGALANGSRFVVSSLYLAADGKMWGKIKSVEYVAPDSSGTYSGWVCILDGKEILCKPVK